MHESSRKLSCNSMEEKNMQQNVCEKDSRMDKCYLNSYLILSYRSY